MQEGLERLHKYADMMKRYDGDKISLDDMWDQDWAIVQRMIVAREQHKQELKDQAERVERLLGTTKGAKTGLRK